MERMPYRVVFFGTPQFAVPILDSLARNAQVVLVVSQPDRPGGRGCKLCKSEVKQHAEFLGIEVIQPTVSKGKRFADCIASYKPDFLVTAAYGCLLGKSVLETPKKASLNVHASLLPKYRGAAPAAWALLDGEIETGVSVMKMEVELDAGPVFSQVKTLISENENVTELLDRLSMIGAEAITNVIQNFDSLNPIEQDHNKATYARMLTKQDGEIDWTRSAQDLHNHIRGMSQWPSAFTTEGTVVLKIHKAQVFHSSGVHGLPGQVVAVSKDGIDTACGQGILRLLEVQAPGKKRMPACCYVMGHCIQEGIVLGRKIDRSN